MPEEMNLRNDGSKSENDKPITSKGYKFLAIWTVTAISISIIAGIFIIGQIIQIKQEEIAGYQEETLKSYIGLKNDSFKNSPIIQKSTNVKVGVCIDHIKELNVKDLRWIVDFSIWFVWDNNSRLSPGTQFDIINGYIDEGDKELLTWGETNESIRWELYKVVASISQNFNARLYPFDTQYLAIKVEDSCDNIKRLKYIPDEENSTVSDRINISGIRMAGHLYPIVRQGAYNTNFGNVNQKSKNGSIYSQISFIVPVKRNDPLLLFLKLFQGLIVAVVVSILAFFIKPTWVDPRFGLGIGGLFAAVANNYIVSFTLPITGVVTLVGLLHGIGVTIIFYTIVESVLSLYLYDSLNEKSLSRLFDKVSFVTFITIFIVMITAVCAFSM